MLKNAVISLICFILVAPTSNALTSQEQVALYEKEYQTAQQAKITYVKDVGVDKAKSKMLMPKDALKWINSLPTPIKKQLFDLVEKNWFKGTIKHNNVKSSDYGYTVTVPNVSDFDALKRLWNLCVSKSNVTVLSIGAGYGGIMFDAVMAILRYHNQGGNQFHTLDIDEEAVSHLKKHSRSNQMKHLKDYVQTTVRIAKGDFSDFKVQNNTYDFIIYKNVAHFLTKETQNHHLSKIYNLLIPGGTCYAQSNIFHQNASESSFSLISTTHDLEKAHLSVLDAYYVVDLKAITSKNEPERTVFFGSLRMDIADEQIPLLDKRNVINIHTIKINAFAQKPSNIISVKKTDL